MTAAPIDGPGLDDLGPEALLDALADADRQVREGEREKLRIAHQWAVRHPATAETGVATWGGDILLVPALRTDESLGGDGCPMVAAYAPEPLAITLGVAPTTAMQLIADALDLHHRLPETWARVESLAVPAWKGRHVARLTHSMSREAAEWVDKLVAPRLARCGARPARHRRRRGHREARPRPPRRARGAHEEAGLGCRPASRPTAPEYAATSELHITGDTLWLTDLYRQVCGDAAARGKAGDGQPLGVRKFQALATLFEAVPRDDRWLSDPLDARAGTQSSRNPRTREAPPRRQCSISTSTPPTSTTTS